MKKTDVKVGGEYYANVTNKKVVVRIDKTNSSGGWDATNLSTNKKVRIKTAQRLLGAVRARKRVPKKATKAKQTAGSRKLSCVGAAIQVLKKARKPMNAQEMISAMGDQGLWESPGGKTPHATLYSAILRDLKRGDDSRFVKTERGRFTTRN